jgi:hypothetical protein
MDENSDTKPKTQTNDEKEVVKKKFVKPVLVKNTISELVDNDFILLAGFSFCYGGGY